MEKPSNFSKPAIPVFHNLYTCRFSLWSNLKFPFSRKPLICCTTHHDTEHTCRPFSAQLLECRRHTTSLPIFLFFRLNNYISSDPFPRVISLRYRITILWTLSNDAHVALRGWPTFGQKCSSRGEEGLFTDLPGPTFSQTHVTFTPFVTAWHCWPHTQCMTHCNSSYFSKGILSKELITILSLLKFFLLQEFSRESTIHHCWL